MVFFTYHTSAPYGALFSINVMNFALIYNDRIAGSLNLC